VQTCRVRVRVPVRVHVPTNWSRLGDDVKVILASCGIQHVGMLDFERSKSLASSKKAHSTHSGLAIVLQQINHIYINLNHHL
jgi:hypothetical protein